MQGTLTFTAESRQFPPDDLPLLTAQVRLPHWDGQGARRFNRYYAIYADAFFAYCRQWLLPQAQQTLALAQQSGGPLPEWEITLDTHITLQRETLLSLYTDTVERTGARPFVLRRSDTWDLRDASPLPLWQFFPDRFHGKKRLIQAVSAQIRRQQELGISCYHPDWQRRIRTAFSADHFYLTEENLCLFYQMYAIAPAVEGVPVFALPYDGESGPWLESSAQPEVSPQENHRERG